MFPYMNFSLKLSKVVVALKSNRCGIVFFAPILIQRLPHATNFTSIRLNSTD